MVNVRDDAEISYESGIHETVLYRDSPRESFSGISECFSLPQIESIAKLGQWTNLGQLVIVAQLTKPARRSSLLCKLDNDYRSLAHSE
jgi:hypothetical protein